MVDHFHLAQYSLNAQFVICFHCSTSYEFEASIELPLVHKADIVAALTYFEWKNPRLFLRIWERSYMHAGYLGTTFPVDVRSDRIEQKGQVVHQEPPQISFGVDSIRANHDFLVFVIHPAIILPKQTACLHLEYFAKGLFEAVLQKPFPKLSPLVCKPKRHEIPLLIAWVSLHVCSNCLSRRLFLIFRR